MTPESVLFISKDVLANDLGDETVLLNLKTGMYYGLDSVGTLIWNLIEEDGRLSNLHSRLMDTYDAASEQIWADLVTLVDLMCQKGLLEHRPEGGAGF